MDKNPYDNSLNWIQPPSYSENRQGSGYTTPPQQGPTQKQNMPKAAAAKPARKPNMPKQQALALVSSLKKGIAVSSIIGFGVFGWLATGHTVGATTSQTGSSSSTATPSTTGSSTSTTKSSPTPTATASSSSSSSSSSQQGGGYGFGSGSSSQSPVSGSSVS